MVPHRGEPRSNQNQSQLRASQAGKFQLPTLSTLPTVAPLRHAACGSTMAFMDESKQSVAASVAALLSCLLLVPTLAILVAYYLSPRLAVAFLAASPGFAAALGAVTKHVIACITGALAGIALVELLLVTALDTSLREFNW